VILALAQSTTLGADPVPIGGQAIVVVIIAIAVLAGLGWLARNSRFARRTGAAVSVESAVPLGERRSLVIVTVEGRRLLLGLTPNQITLVTELHQPFRDALDARVQTSKA
jgi:flagellar protein FliO/FliZ